MHVDNKNRNISVLVEDSTQRLDNTTITAEAKYSINFTKSGRRFALSLYYNGNRSFLFFNATKIYKFKAKDSEMKLYSWCLGNIS